MSSMTRSIRRHAQRNRHNTVARKVCPDCGSVLKAQSADKFSCKKCRKTFTRKR